MIEVNDTILNKIREGKNLSLPFVYDYKIMYIKKDNGDCGLNELLGKKLANIFGISSANYYLVTVDNENYIISESLENYGEFLKCSNFSLEDSNNLYDIWYYLENNFINIEELMEQLIKVYLFDMLFCNFDRHQENWGVVSNCDTNKLCIFDNAEMFNTQYKPSLYCSTDNDDIEDDYISYLVELVREITVFKSHCSSEFIENSIEILNKIDVETLNNLISEVELIAGRKYINRPSLKKFTQIRDIMLTNLKEKENISKKIVMVYKNKRVIR